MSNNFLKIYNYNSEYRKVDGLFIGKIIWFVKYYNRLFMSKLFL